MTLDEFIENLEWSIKHNNDPIKAERFQKELACLRGVWEEIGNLKSQLQYANATIDWIDCECGKFDFFLTMPDRVQNKIHDRAREAPEKEGQ